MLFFLSQGVDLPRLQTLDLGYAALSGQSGNSSSTLEMRSTSLQRTLLC